MFPIFVPRISDPTECPTCHRPRHSGSAPRNPGIVLIYRSVTGDRALERAISNPKSLTPLDYSIVMHGQRFLIHAWHYAGDRRLQFIDQDDLKRLGLNSGLSDLDNSAE